MKEITVDKMNDLTPSEFITLMFERTDEDGILYIPGWHRDDHGWKFGVPGSNGEDDKYRVKIKWNLFDYERILKKFEKHLETIKKMAAITADGAEVSGEMKAFWDKYLADFDTEDIDFDKLEDIDDRLDTLEWIKYIKSRLSNGEEVDEDEKQALSKYKDLKVTSEEEAYYDRYVELIKKDSERRVGKGVCPYRVVIHSMRLHKLFEIQAPKIVTDNEARQLAAAYVIHEYGISMEVVDKRNP